MSANDIALEIGCDFGYTTKILGEKCKIALGVDKRYSHVKDAIKNYGIGGGNNDNNQIYFHSVDIFTNSDNILGKYATQLEHNPTIIFIDINGNRELQAVVKALNVVYQRYTPRLVVIKSSSFFNYLYDDTTINNNNNMKQTAITKKQDATAGIQDDYVYEQHQIHFM